VLVGDPADPEHRAPLPQFILKTKPTPTFNRVARFSPRALFFLGLLLTLVALLVIPRCAEAQTTLTASGNWNNSANWSNGLPTAILNATVDNNLTVSAPVGVSGTDLNLFVGNSGTGTLNITGGTVTTNQYIYLGNNAGSNGTLNVSSGTFTSGSYSTIAVGQSGTGTLNITGGTMFTGGAYIGSNAGSNGTVTISGGTWTIPGSMQVGNSGTGTLNLNGGFLNCSSVLIGYNAGSSGSVTVTSGTLNCPSALSVGQGILNINGSS